MNTPLIAMLRQMSPTDFAALGTREMAYIRVLPAEGRATFAVHAADGAPLTVADSRDLAIAICIQNDLEPVSVH
ncbi:MAG: DUF1150 family protein [Inquilinus sp.]|nr:DUF1150 family protein [Inquilinus sp.]